jgi:uncharacterized repeat protein (TIGR03803 family)
VYSFTGGDDGASPSAALVQGSDGFFYGTTIGGGTNAGYGTVFKISADGAVTTLYSFSGGNDGLGPSGLVQGSDGYFYGTTLGRLSILGSIRNPGTVFKISTNGDLTTLYSFTGGNDGWDPEAALAQGSDGYFYGTTSCGSVRPCYASPLGSGTAPGTIFKISTNGDLTTFYSFTNGNDSEVSFAGLVEGSDGNFYGTTEEGGTQGAGTVFQVSTNGALKTLYSFTGGNDGAYPQATLVQGSDGYFYGTTEEGGTNSVGTVFKISTVGALTTLYEFGTVTNLSGVALDGAIPVAGLVQGRGGYFYGTTSGSDPCVLYPANATVFKITTNGTLTTLYSFTNGNDGGDPVAGLVQGRDGNFYGTTSIGGAGGFGTVFRLTMVPEFQAVTLTNATLSLTFNTEAGGMYQLQYNADLTSTNWTNLGNPIPATASTLTATDTLTHGPQRFYRLVLAP